jgi:hypothetical protein
VRAYRGFRENPVEASNLGGAARRRVTKGEFNKFWVALVGAIRYSATAILAAKSGTFERRTSGG